MAGITYDTGALFAAEKDHREMWLLHMSYVDLDVLPTVPAPVLAEAWRGDVRQARLARLLRGCAIEALTEAQARRVGVLAGRAKRSDIVDVTVVEGAVRRGDAIVTSDPRDIEAIAHATSARPRILAV